MIKLTFLHWVPHSEYIKSDRYVINTKTIVWPVRSDGTIDHIDQFKKTTHPYMIYGRQILIPSEQEIQFHNGNVDRRACLILFSSPIKEYAGFIVYKGYIIHQ